MSVREAGSEAGDAAAHGDPASGARELLGRVFGYAASAVARSGSSSTSPVAATRWC